MSTHRNNLASWLLMAVLLALVSGCATGRQTKSLDLTLREYEKLVRWSQWDAAVEFVAPEMVAAGKPSPLDLERLRLYRVTRYETRSATLFDEGNAYRQTVLIGLFNRNRAVERDVLDVQEWRFDGDRKRWFLHSGLPDVTRAR